jgi:outer membrane protein OmpA-like peptidoglycan-associated protein
MTRVWIANGLIFLIVLATVAFVVRGMVQTSVARLLPADNGGAAALAVAGATSTNNTPANAGATASPAAPVAAVAQGAEVEYCSEHLKTVLRRVLSNCGLLGTGRRGCQPGELRNVAQISDGDFNALFQPLAQRGGMVLFDVGKEELDPAGKALVEKLWAERKGGSYFLVVARASTDGDTAKNQALSHRRANSILFHLEERFKDPELQKKVGLLWLGEEYAQLEESFCSWTSNRPDAECKPEVINRSAVLSWIDCRL